MIKNASKKKKHFGVTYHKLQNIYRKGHPPLIIFLKQQVC